MCEMWGDHLSEEVEGKVQYKGSEDKHLTAQSLSTISLPLWCSGLRDCPVTSDCVLETFKMTGTGTLVNMEGEKTGGVYPALKVSSIYSHRSVKSRSQAQSRSLLPDPLWVTPTNNLAPPKSQCCHVGQVPKLLHHQSFLLWHFSRPDQTILWSKTPQTWSFPSSQKTTTFKQDYGVLNNAKP